MPGESLPDLLRTLQSCDLAPRLCATCAVKAITYLAALPPVALEEDSFPLMLCNAGCGCRISDTQYHSDADARDCACAGPCGWDTWNQFIRDILERPEEYQWALED